jgi:uncharacterized protein (UPF0261 family)
MASSIMGTLMPKTRSSSSAVLVVLEVLKNLFTGVLSCSAGRFRELSETPAVAILDSAGAVAVLAMRAAVSSTTHCIRMVLEERLRLDLLDVGC